MAPLAPAFTTARATRVRLTGAQKHALLKHHADHPHRSLRQLCAWAADEFKLPQQPAASTLVLLFKNSTPSTERTNRKTKQPVACARLEEELVQWIDKCEALRLPVVTGATVRAKAAKIRERMMRDSTTVTPKFVRMTFSVGWLQKLQKRHGMKVRKVHGEAASTPAIGIDAGRVKLQQVTSKYSRRDVFNINESAYFYCSIPDSSISRQRMSGRKQSKKRITVAIAANADGSCKLSLLFVGTAARPRCFGSQTAAELGIEYTSSQKGWMTTAHFCAWVHRFNADMQRENRHVLLLLDNASPHRITESLSNVTLQFLPPNTTAHLQPLNAGVIRSFKGAINGLRNRYVVEKLDALLAGAGHDGAEEVSVAVESLYNVDVLTAMRWANEAWCSVTKSTIANCWRHTGILDSDIYELVEAVETLRLARMPISQ